MLQGMMNLPKLVVMDGLRRPTSSRGAVVASSMRLCCQLCGAARAVAPQSIAVSRSRHFASTTTTVMQPELDQYYECVLALVNDAGKLIRENITRQKTIVTKSCEVDLVTETDQMVEKMLMNGIAAKFPDHKFIGEENTAETSHRVELTDAPTWIIDPVDGTMNFVHSMPHTCISIALYIDKVPEIGIVYNPVLEQFFSARRGKGAFHNGTPIRVSGEKDLNKALVMMEMGTSRDPEKVKVVMENLRTLTPLVHGTRALGSCALNMCMVALGAADLMYEFGIHIWDVAAGDLIVREAGGICIDPAGGDFDPLSRRVLCAASGEVAQKASKLLTQYYPDRD